MSMILKQAYFFKSRKTTFQYQNFITLYKNGNKTKKGKIY
jgi:hypothetical protein